jgi:hypothetical protein
MKTLFERGYYDTTPRGAYMGLRVYDMTPRGSICGEYIKHLPYTTV